MYAMKIFKFNIHPKRPQKSDLRIPRIYNNNYIIIAKIDNVPLKLNLYRGSRRRQKTNLYKKYPSDVT